MRNVIAALLLATSFSPVLAAETSVRPNVNQTYKNPGLDAATQDKGFTSENRETYASREAVTTAVGLKPGMAIADVGAGTGIYVPLFSKAVGPSGNVYAVDIAQPMLAFIEKKMKAEGATNVTMVLADDKSTKLATGSVDVIFTSDVYHHFEFPQTTLADIRRALKDGGEFIVVDYDHVPGVTPPSMLQHVRTDKKTVIAEVTQAGFKPPQEVTIPGFKSSFFLRFKK